ncbi:Ribosomal protein S12 methylthiotransferase RimO [uncultured delta proteobacterium]|uniref:Ribosomal protein uS12 methylthiotransferase RimO n=1 Tax=uncultured delta proteobacterium TaxID=34034 RepID=A0A212JL11_9DELT|nr:Ribosomal protein S12 methylthiotransferase RimO [uncultured delta proteobacterium]
MANIYSVSLGCPKNRVDTERLLASIPNMTVVESMDAADCVIINTCAFIDPAIRESVSVIAESIVDAGDLRPKPLLAVAGCLVGRYGAAELAPELPEVDLWLDNRALDSWPETLRAAMAAHGIDVSGQCAGTRFLSTGPSYAWLKISDGCDHTCSFCTIPFIRGKFHSTPQDVLVREAAELLGLGARELILVAQDTTAWGKDLPKDLPGEKGLMALMERLLPLKGLDWLRILYMYPAGLSREFLTFLRDVGRPFVPYFDVPVQHAHPDVLARMGRPFARDPEKALDRVREFFPEAALRTSIIVGFPGETDAHFKTLYDFVERTRFLHLGVFAYQAEAGTAAAAMPDQVPDAVKEERRAALMELQAGTSEELLEDFVGESMDILVDAPHPEWPGLFTGRAWFQAPEIDGLTYISGPGVAAGRMVRADIVESRVYDLVGLAEPEE